MTGIVMREVKIAVVKDLMEGLLRAAGCPAESSAKAAHIFLEADLRGVHVQGLHLLVLSLLNWLRVGKVDAKAAPRIVEERSGSVLVDGNRGLGQLAGEFAADLAVKKAAISGSCAVGITNSSDIFLVGYYVERIARAGCVGFVLTDAICAVHPAGGIDPVLGTNPIGIGVPTAQDDPIVLDLATSAWLRSAIRWAARDGREISDGVAIGPDGAPTRDPVEALKGAVSPMAGHKGSGLALMVALLSGPLVGAVVGRGLDGWRPGNTGAAGNKGHLFIAIDPSAFGDPMHFRAAVSEYVREIKASRKAPGVAEILMPGERSFEARRRSLSSGLVSVDEVIWSEALAAAKALGVSIPKDA